jgi:putative transcriptional regulator
MIPLSIDRQRYPVKGDLLLSEPFLMDDHFTRSVILIGEHSEKGSFGLVLNQSLDVSLSDILDEFPTLSIRVGIGGPVEQNQLFFLHNSSEIEHAEKISNQCYLGGNFEQLVQMVAEGKMDASNIRFFIGYTGWGEQQLISEIKEKTWIVMEQPSNFNVFTTDDSTLWKNLLKQLGGNYETMANYPVNPSDN